MKIFIFIPLIIIAITSACSTSPTPAATQTPQPTITPTPQTFKVTFIAFHDYNGNGKQEEGEPALEGILITTSAGQCISDKNGECGINEIIIGENKINVSDYRKVPLGDKMRYIYPSISDVRTISQGLMINITSELIIFIPLGHGFLTFPFESNIRYELFSFYDLDPRTNSVRYYSGSTKIAQGNINIPHKSGTAPGHNGIDYLMVEGKKILAAAPGVVLNVGDNFYSNCAGMVIVSIKHVDGFISHYGHLKESTTYVGQIVNRGEVIGISGNSGSCSGGAHLHFGFSPRTFTYENNRTIDPYRDEIEPNGSIGYWTVNNQPKFPLVG